MGSQHWTAWLTEMVWLGLLAVISPGRICPGTYCVPCDVSFQLASLLLDGMTGLIQDSLRSTHSVSAYHMMYAVNAFSAVYLSVSVVASGELWRVTGFIQRHPTVLLNIAIFSISSAIGQVHTYCTCGLLSTLPAQILDYNTYALHTKGEVAV